MLVRAGRNYAAWEGIYAEDLKIYLPQALQHPWHLLVHDDGYIELVPADSQFVTYLPLREAATAFAIGGVDTAGCALYLPRQRGARPLPLLRLVLAWQSCCSHGPDGDRDSGEDDPWYMDNALYWAC